MMLIKLLADSILAKATSKCTADIGSKEAVLK